MDIRIERENPLVQICLNTVVVMEKNIEKERSLLYTLYNGKNQSSENVYVFEITDPNELCYLYYLVISETIFMDLKKINRLDYSFNDFPYKMNLVLNACLPNDNNLIIDTSTNSALSSPTTNTHQQEYKAKFDISEENNPSFSVEMKTLGAILVVINLKVVKSPDNYINKFLSYYLNDARTQIDYLTDEKKETEEKLKNKEEECEDVTRKYEEYVNTNKIEFQKIENEHIIQIGQKENEYKEEMNKLSEKYGNEKMEIVDKYNQQIEELKKDIDNLTNKYKELSAKNSDLKIKHKNLVSDFDIQTEELKRKREENKQLLEENDKLKIEQHQKETNLNNNNTTIQSMKNEIENLKLKISSQEKEIENMKEMKESIEKNKDELKELNIVLTEKYNTALDEIEKANKIFQEYSTRLNTQKQNNNILKNAYRESDKKIKELELQITSKENEIETLKIVNNSRENDIMIYKDKLDEKDKQLEESKDLLEKNEGAMTYLNKRITELETQIREHRYGKTFGSGNVNNATVFQPFQAKDFNYSREIGYD